MKRTTAAGRSGNEYDHEAAVNDATRIADLLAHGLIRSSFVPPAAIQELRDLTRTRKQLTREIAQHRLRIQKLLQDANLNPGACQVM
jgi:transposase